MLSLNRAWTNLNRAQTNLNWSWTYLWSDLTYFIMVPMRISERHPFFSHDKWEPAATREASACKVVRLSNACKAGDFPHPPILLLYPYSLLPNVNPSFPYKRKGREGRKERKKNQILGQKILQKLLVVDFSIDRWAGLWSSSSPACLEMIMKDLASLMGGLTPCKGEIYNGLFPTTAGQSRKHPYLFFPHSLISSPYLSPCFHLDLQQI